MAVGIILLFVGTGIIPAIAQDIQKPLPTSRGNWLYVGGSGPENYTRIQDAINASFDGDTVYVYDDSSPYYEHILINTSIRIFGECRETTTINGDGEGTVISCYSNNVTINNFTIEQSGRNRWSDAGIKLHGNAYYPVSGCTLSNLTITNNAIGIFLISSCFTDISNTTITNCSYVGIDIGDELSFDFVPSHNKIHNNIIFNNGEEGIKIESLSLPGYLGLGGNEIYQNVITSNGWKPFDVNRSFLGGIVFIATNSNSVFENVIVNNPIGIVMAAVYHTCSNNTVYLNDINLNKIGIVIKPPWLGYSAGGNKIFKNNFVNNKIHALNSDKNVWDDGMGHGNYWDNWIGVKYEACSKLPKIILGRTYYLPLPRFNFDWYPAQEPYKIGE